jgi:hypothetical protein
VGPCDDANACTATDTCGAGGECYGQPIVCDDGEACTDDACVPLQGCTVVFNENACDDGTACTEGDQCDAGNCLGTFINCADDNPCTDDSCDAAFGCQSAANLALCDDDDACTSDDACSAGSCAGTLVNCSNLDAPCQIGFCDNGACVAEAVSCGIVSVRLHAPGGILQALTPGAHGLRASVGHAGPVGKANAPGNHSINFGFQATVNP